MATATPVDLSGVMAQVDRYKGLLSRYYIILFLVVFILAAFLPRIWEANVRGFSKRGAIAGPIALLIVAFLASYSNLRVIQADIVFKLADPFTRNGQWPVAIAIYNHANELASNEDYYYLFLGRAYLEHAKTLSDSNERDLLISQAERDLKKAQSLNPLNTDHTANLARLFSLWASFVQDGTDRLEKGRISNDYFSRAVTLSPKNARIWDEWALLYLNVLNQPEEAQKKLMQSIDVDPDYHWTYGLLSELHTRASNTVDDPEAIATELTSAANYLNTALELRTPGEPQAKYGYAIALGGIEAQLGNYSQAIEAYYTAIDEAPQNAEIWRIEEAITSLFVQIGDYEQAILHVQEAIRFAPDTQKERLQELLAQLKQVQE
jgi:tetratricopeptide (TPR) repeat protein